MTKAIQQAADLVATARSVAVLSGAGMSAESGIPTFRDAQTGMWERFVPEQLATESAFRANPALVWTWYMWRWHLVNSVMPNAGHNAIGHWQQHLAANHGTLTVATQNVDDLHERGGATDVLHLHGSLGAFRCIDCHRAAAFSPGVLDYKPRQNFDDENLWTPVACQHCATGVLRPAVVWFGEALPQETFQKAIDQLRTAELVVVIGSSGLVQPAASLPLIGRDAGCMLIEINPSPTELSRSADVHLASTAAVALPLLVAKIV